MLMVEDKKAMRATLESETVGADAHLVYADLCEELGEVEEASRHRQFATKCDVLAVKKALREANGKRRERLLSLDRILFAVHDVAISAGSVYRALDGGTVRASYGYASSCTYALSVMRTNGSIRVGVTSGPTNRQAVGQFLNHVPRNAVKLRDALTQWADTN